MISGRIQVKLDDNLLGKVFPYSAFIFQFIWGHQTSMMILVFENSCRLNVKMTFP